MESISALARTYAEETSIKDLPASSVKEIVIEMIENLMKTNEEILKAKLSKEINFNTMKLPTIDESIELLRIKQ